MNKNPGFIHRNYDIQNAAEKNENAKEENKIDYNHRYHSNLVYRYDDRFSAKCRETAGSENCQWYFGKNTGNDR